MTAATQSTKSKRAVRAPSGGTLYPFEPGKSGNPGGRPALPPEFKAKGPDALMKIANLMQSKNEQIALRAAEIVVDRIYGKPVQRHEVTLDDVRERARAMAQEMGLDPELAVAEAEALMRGER